MKTDRVALKEALTVFKLKARAGVIAGVVGLVVLGLASPAAAHVEVTLTPAQAGASGVTMTVNAEAESDSAGVKEVRVVLPEGIAPTQVAWKSGPAGWALTPTSDGFSVAGKAVPVGRDAKFSVTVAQLPTNATTLSFKVLMTYSDGRIDRWIGATGDANPAPVVKVKAAATPSAAPSASPSPSAAPSSAAPPSPAVSPSPYEEAIGGEDGLWWVVPAIVVVLVAGAAWLAFGRRRSSAPEA
ncbi:DUF1775 domain-containing protein [Catellatospora sp. NPDC049111]|uniref:DUF1775 domain-containing protein n=1 Tax=Catellatospora sp. NPDC049111 TaxID=3155271 RepID=UPI0033FE36C2